MPRFEIKVSKQPKVEIPKFSAEQIKEIAEYAIDVMKARNAAGTDVLDQPAKPLQPKYAERKAKKGKQPIRDIRFTGNTLGSVQVKDSDETHALIGIRGSTPFRKALFNQNIDPWFGLSSQDEQHVLHDKVQPMFAQNLKDAFK